MRTAAVAACAALTLATSAFAQDMPVPKMLKGMQGEKGRYRMEVLEGGGRAVAKGMTITLCTDNLLSSANRDRAKGDSSCTHKLLKDTADEAVVERECKEQERKTTVTLKRESGKSMLMTMESTGAKGPQSMKMRATHLGPCRDG
jgi:hypothetical protein